MSTGLRIEHLCDNFESAKLTGSKLASFHVCYIHFSVPPTRITDLVRNVSDQKNYRYGTFTLSASILIFAFINLVCVQSVTQLMNALFITLCYNIKTFSFLFQEWLLSKTLNCNFLYLYTSRPSVIFCWIKRVRVSRDFIVFSSYTFHRQSYQFGILIISKRYMVSFDPANFKMSKIYQGIFSSYAVWHNYFSIPHQSVHRKRAKSFEKIFSSSQLQFGQFVEISRNRCANTSIHWRKLKHPTKLLFWMVLTADL